MFTIEPYRNPLTPTLLNLIGGADRARAAATMASGQAVAQGAQQVGQEAGATLNNFVKLKLDEPRRQMEGLQLQSAQRQAADDAAARDAFKEAQGDPDKAVSLLESKGHYTVAMKLRSELVTNRVKALDITKTQLDVNEKRLTQASQLLQGITALPPERRSAAYTSVLPSVRQIVGDQLGAQLPDQYDENAVNQALTWGMRAGDVIRMRRDAAGQALNATRNAVTQTELVGKLTSALAQSASTVESQEEWDKARDFVTKIGGADVAPLVLDKFPTAFSADGLKAAATKALTPAGPTKYQHDNVIAQVDGKWRILEAGYDNEKNQWFAPGSTTPLTNVRRFERDPAGKVDTNGLVQAVLAHPEAYNDLTDSAKTAIWPALHQAGFTPPPKTDRGASAATAERWRMNQLAKVQNDLDLALITPEQATARKAEVEASYRVQLGRGAPAAKPGAPPTPAPTAPAKAPAAPKGAPTAVPDAVSSLLATQKAGTYTLSDGSVWVKDAAGTITKKGS